VPQAVFDAGQTLRLIEEDVLAFCRERLANYKVPRRVVFCAALPRNASGKVLRRQLRAELTGEP
jgi:acyl-CoA synthetase (AMP-forming)/AMP-acid ligase II